MKFTPRYFDFPCLAFRWCLIAVTWLGTLIGGLASIFYEGPYALLVRQDVNGVLYTMAWAFGLALLAPRARASLLARAALGISFAMEFLQLWHPHALEVLRAEPLGRLALGSAFSGSDFFFYAVGAFVAYGWLAMLPFRSRRSAASHVRPLGVPA